MHILSTIVHPDEGVILYTSSASKGQSSGVQEIVGNLFYCAEPVAVEILAKRESQDLENRV